METILCPVCHKEISLDMNNVIDKVFCSYCGSSIALDPSALDSVEDREIQAKVNKLMEDRDPVKIHNELVKLNDEYPNNIHIKRALLMQGNLHMRNSKNVDFSIIHCHLINVFLETEVFRGKKRADMIKELTAAPILQECLKISKNPNKFLQEYYTDISSRFIELFLKGSNKYMLSFFGLNFGRKASKSLSIPAAKIISNILSSNDMNYDYALILAKSFYTAFGKQLDNDFSYINEELNEQSYAAVKSPYAEIKFGDIDA